METPTASTSTAQSDDIAIGSTDIAIGSTDIRDANGVSHTATASLTFAPAAALGYRTRQSPQQ